MRAGAVSDVRGLGRACAAAAIAFTLAVGALSVPISATAEDAPPELEAMGEFPAEEYVEAAAELPTELVDAIERDLDKSAEEYLAESDAAQQAVEVVESIDEVGVEVLGSSIEGTTLVVNIADAQDASLVESTGAIARVGEPAPFVLEGEPTRTADIWGGQGYIWSDGDWDYQCSVGFNGFVIGTGARELTTAGHCLVGAENIAGSVRVHNQAAPGLFNGTLGDAIGAPNLASIRDDLSHPGYDVARVAVSNPSMVARPGVVSWGGGAGGPLSGTPSVVTGTSAAIVGASLCRSGSRTGWRCGPVVEVDYNDADYEGGTLDINTVVARVCSRPGDSGGAAIIGTNAVGLSSWTTAPETNDNTCAGTTYSAFFQMISPAGLPSVATAYPEWEPAVTVRTPAVSTAAGAANPSAIQGTLANASASSAVSLFLDGATTAFATVSAASGSWSFPTSAIPAGLHTYSVVATYGTWSKSTPATGYFSKGVTVDRLAGVSRLETGIAVARAGFPAGPVPVLYVSTAYNYPDALSSGPASVHLGGPLVLVDPSALSTGVRDLIVDLDPARVVVLGAANSVSATVFDQIEAAVPDAEVDRVSGPDRYSTGIALNRDAFVSGGTASGGTVGFISNGQNFPDALSAGGAAATFDGPVILVNGLAPDVPAATIQLIRDMGLTQLYVTGQANSVSDGIFAQLDALPGMTVTRLSGPDRYSTSIAINKAFFTGTESRVLLATGTNFPDALAGSSLAGTIGGPLYITYPECIASTTYDELVRLKVTHVTLLGGEPSVSANVAALKRC